MYLSQAAWSIYFGWSFRLTLTKFEKCLNNKTVVVVLFNNWELSAIAQKILSVPVGFLNMQNNAEL